jgi:RNA polymerase sigma factor (sigma-70 family)
MAVTLQPSEMDSTLDLLSRARAGDRRALECIAERYRGALTRFAHGRLPAGARSLAETCDLVQVALVRTLGRLDTFDAGFRGSLLAYLRRAVLNQVRDEIRRATRRPRPVALSEELPSHDPDPLAQVIRDEWLERYEAALADLPADQQEAFMMRIEMGCGYGEIADALGRSSAEAARMLVRRAIHALARTLGRVSAP